MALAQNVTSLALSLRKKERLRVRQPLQKIMIPILDEKMKTDIEKISAIIKSEINVKEIEFLEENSAVLTKQIKPNFKTLGPKFGNDMKLIAAKIAQFSADNISEIEKNNSYQIADGIIIDLADVEISSADIPGFSVATNDGITVALDIKLSKDLKEEGLAREFINRIQVLRKEKGFEVTDTIKIEIAKNQVITTAINNNLNYICGETLTNTLVFSDAEDFDGENLALINEISVKVKIIKD